MQLTYGQAKRLLTQKYGKADGHRTFCRMRQGSLLAVPIGAHYLHSVRYSCFGRHFEYGPWGDED